MLSTTVYGRPIPEGSLKGIYSKKQHRVFLVHQNKKELDPYRNRIADEVSKRMSTPGCERFDPLDRKAVYSVTVCFNFTQAKSNKDKYMCISPDLDKLTRAVGDALTDVVWYDDSQIIEWHVKKQYAEGDARTCIDIALIGHADKEATKQIHIDEDDEIDPID